MKAKLSEKDSTHVFDVFARLREVFYLRDNTSETPSISYHFNGEVSKRFRKTPTGVTVFKFNKYDTTFYSNGHLLSVEHYQATDIGGRHEDVEWFTKKYYTRDGTLRVDVVSDSLYNGTYFLKADTQKIIATIEYDNRPRVCADTFLIDDNDCRLYDSVGKSLTTNVFRYPIQFQNGVGIGASNNKKASTLPSKPFFFIKIRMNKSRILKC